MSLETSLGIIKNKSQVYDVQVLPVKAAQKLTRGLLLTKIPTTGVEPAGADVKKGEVGVIEADSDNTSGAKGAKYVQVFGTNTIVTVQAGAEIVPTTTRRLKSGAGGKPIPMVATDDEDLHIANYLGKVGESEGVGVELSTAALNDEIEVEIQ